MIIFWRRPIFPEGCPSSIVGANGFHFRVRDGNGWGTAAIATRNLVFIEKCFFTTEIDIAKVRGMTLCGMYARTILFVLPAAALPELRYTRHLMYPTHPRIFTRVVGRCACAALVSSKALGHLVRVSSTCHHAYTPRLSTRLSAGDLTRLSLWGF